MWCLVFAGVHVFWAVGGSAALAASAGPQLARQRPMWFVAAGLWGVTGLLLAGAALAVTLAAGTPTTARDAERYRRIVTAGGWGAVLLLALRTVPTLVQDVLTEAGLLSPPTLRSADWSLIHWRLALWTPWFALGVALFALALRRHLAVAITIDTAGTPLQDPQSGQHPGDS